MHPIAFHHTVAVTRRAVSGARAQDPVTRAAPSRPIGRRRRRTRLGPAVLRFARLAR